MYTVPITRFVCEHFSNTVCVTVCSWCLFGVANDHMREFAKVVSVPHHRVPGDLPETSGTRSGRSDLAH